MVWFSRLDIAQPETRKIPAALAPIITSPIRTIPQFLLHSSQEQVLTNQSLKQHWSFVYFTHPSCQPECEPILTVLKNLKQYFSMPEVQTLLINFDSQQNIIHEQSGGAFPFPLYGAEQQSQIDALAESFGFLYLREQFKQGYRLEQQHHIFLVDPKGRVYARFEPPFTSPLLQQRFLAIREFYARSE
ncbi:SCO family protein [Methylophaga sp.]|uniref:SCO family protein n=1 Tax=Methylophaga sp. TaxID=2024840 RepID=UPI003F69734B